MNRVSLIVLRQRLNYAFVSPWIAAASIAWFPLPAPFDPYKHHAIGTVIAILAVCFAIAGFRVNPSSRRSAVAGMGLGIFSFLTYLLIVPL